jgi:homoserine dehydrogenase
MIHLGLLGNGTVGSGVLELVERNASNIEARTGQKVCVSKVLVRNLDKHLGSKYKDVITDDINEFYDEKINIVIEVMGGLHPAYEYIKTFLSMKKHIVTANKDVVAKYGEELSSIAERNGVSFRFEASVAGGIPVIKPLQECLAGNNISSIKAILNGTTNFILSKMFNENVKYEAALKEAQRLGFAEANPEADVMGYDAARKLAILSSIAYHDKIDWEDIYTEGITHVDEMDIRIAKTLNARIKLLALSNKEDSGVYAAVRPSFVLEDGYIGKVTDEFNGILVEGDAVGQVFFFGKGAGKLPTASSVLGDVINVLENNNQRPMLLNVEPRPIINKLNSNSQWVVRIDVRDIALVKVLVREYLRDITEIDIDSTEVYSALVNSESEDQLDLMLNKLSEHSEVLNIKKFIKFDNI